MLTSASKMRSPNKSDIGPGETLFEFLKRKKKYSLEESLKKKVNHSSYADTDRGFETINIDFLDQELPKTSRPSTTHRNYPTNKKPSTTPKKVSFAEATTHESKTNMGKSFLQMLSPYKRRLDFDGEEKVDEEKKIRHHSSSKEKEKISGQLFSRKKLKQSMGIFKETLQKFLVCGKTLSQKIHSLNIQLRPLLRFIEQNSNKTQSKHASSVRNKILSIESVLKELEIHKGQQIIENFSRDLAEQIVTAQGVIRSEFQKSEMENIKKIKMEDEKKINLLKDQNYQLEREIQTLTKRLQKKEKEYDRMIEQKDLILNQYSVQGEEKIEYYQNKLSSYEEELHKINTKYQQVMENQKKLEKKYKDAVYTGEQNEKKMIQQNIKVKSSREQLYINEIMMLKQEFQKDIQQIVSLHNKKEQDLNIEIEALRAKVNALDEQKAVDSQVWNKILQEAKINKIQAGKYRKQNECLVTDMHRMNEQFYQHWLALKDIRTLANRLDIFSKFSRIYDDFAFNDRLF